MTRVLFIGGSGEISRSCVEAAVRAGHDVTVFNRGRREACPDGARQETGELRDEHAYPALAGRNFDVVCQFIAFDADTVQRDIGIFSGRCGQYVFISSASAYQKPGRVDVITEDTPLDNPFWAYSRHKAACERALVAAHAAGRLPVTIVRPSHTYRTRLPATCIDGDHTAWRLLHGKPLIVHDDGESLWTLTHADDFARAFVRLCANEQALGEAIHITSDDAYTWNAILRGVGDALGCAVRLVPVATDLLIGYEPAWQGPLLGDKANPVVFDNSKLRSVIGDWRCEIDLATGLGRVAEQVQQRLGAGYQPDPDLDALIDTIVAAS